MAVILKPDILILGGGIAGLWLCNLLDRQGYQCLLLESGELGGQQTLKSQGIIHGGLKYALGGTLSNESEAIAGMPDRWRACLAGDDDVDLRQTRVLSDTQYLWSAGSVASRFTTFFASKLLRGRIGKLRRPDYPAALASPAFKGSVYRLDDLVIDTPSLLANLAAPLAGRLLQFDPDRHPLYWNERGIEAVAMDHCRIEPKLTILAAGAGNAALLADAERQGLATALQTQLRPLQMVAVRHRLPTPFYAHCIGASNKPRLTITSHPQEDGSLVWYLGGDLAERGVGKPAAELIGEARQELAELFPWLDFSHADFATLDVDRAEPRQQALVKPDNAFAQRHADLLVCWPTKLTLAPDLGDRVRQLLTEPPSASALTVPEQQARARLAPAPWDALFGQADPQ